MFRSLKRIVNLHRSVFQKLVRSVAVAVLRVSILSSSRKLIVPRGCFEISSSFIQNFSRFYSRFLQILFKIPPNFIQNFPKFYTKFHKLLLVYQEFLKFVICLLVVRNSIDTIDTVFFASRMDYVREE